MSIDGASIHYGKSIGQKEKSIPLETLKGAQNQSKDEMKAQKAPDAVADFGWKLLIVGKDISFCCESEAARSEWVAYLNHLVMHMSAQTSHHVSSTGGESVEDPSGGVYGTTTSQMVARAQDAERDRMTQLSSVAPSNRSGPSNNANWDDDDDDNVSVSPHQASKSQLELRKLVGDGEEEDDFDFDNLVNDEDDDMDDDLSDEEGKQQTGEAGGSSLDDNGSSPKGGHPVLATKDDAYQKFLLPIAQTAHSHIQYKIVQHYGPHFRKDDSIANVLFSRDVHKVAKRDNVQERDLVVTTKYIYLFAKARLLGTTQVRAIELDQLVGVVESTVESNLLALIVPSFHDILIRIVPRNSLIASNEVQVKHQLIAHLYSAHRKLNTGRTFLFREVENVRSVIRRSEDDQHLPLIPRPGDSLQCAMKPDLYPVFRINADSFVLWSSFVTRLNAERTPTRKAFVVADSAFYIVGDDLKKVNRRTPLSEISRIMYDVDLQGILIKCVEVDTLFTVKDAAEFSKIRVLLVEACEAIGHHVRVLSTKQLFSNAQLVETRKLREMFGENAEELKKGMKLTQRLLKKSWKVSLKSVGFVTNSVAKVGGVGVDLLKSAGKEVGGVLVDNQLTGELLGVLGATGLHASSRFLFETLINYQDEEEILSSAVPLVDQLKMRDNAQVQELKLGEVRFSSRCGLYNLTATIDLFKTEDRLVTISSAGITLFHPPDAAFSILSPIRGILAQLSNGLKADTMVDWSTVTGVVRCTQDDNVVGIQTNGGRHADIMIRLPNAALMMKFVATAASMYLQTNKSTKYQRHMLNLFSAPRKENIRTALKKTIFDPLPTIAMRTLMTGGDTMMLSVDQDVAETCRRFGDNTIYFTGIAWRLRSSATKKGNEKMGQIVKDVELKADNKFYKSFVLILTNCAIYQVTKGGYEIARRTDLREITEVHTSKDDPNALLLIVPTEYDMFFQIEGRGAEFLDRLQEAFVTWTDYGAAKVGAVDGEARKGQRAEDFFVPVKTTEDIVARGNLEKPAKFNEEQANKSALETQKAYYQWHKRELVTAVEKYKKAMECAAKGMIYDLGTVPSYDASVAGTPTFREIFTGLENAMALVQFVQSRAYRFGLRASTAPEMASAQRTMIEWDTITTVAEDLEKAIDDEDIERYEERFEELSNYPAFFLLLKEQSGVFGVLRAKKDALNRITALLDNPALSLSSKEKELEAAFEAVASVKVKPQTIAMLRRQVDQRVQQERLAASLSRVVSEGEFATLSTTTKHLLRDAALKLDIDRRLVEEVFGASAARKGSVIADKSVDSSCAVDRPRMKAFTSALAKAVRMGDRRLLTDLVERASILVTIANEKRNQLNAAAMVSLEGLEEELNVGRQQLQVLEEFDEVLRDLDMHRSSYHAQILRQRQQQQAATNNSIVLSGGGSMMGKSFAAPGAQEDSFDDAGCSLVLDVLKSQVSELDSELRAMEAIEKKLHTEAAMNAPVLAVARSIATMRRVKIEERLLSTKEELRLGATEAQALADARDIQLQREEAERQREALERLKEDEAQHERRLEFLNMWSNRTQKLATSIKNAVQIHDTQIVKQCIRNCVVFQEDVKNNFAAMVQGTQHQGSTLASSSSSNTSPSRVDMSRYQPQLDDIIKRLAQAAKQGQHHIDHIGMSAADGGQQQQGGSPTTEEGDAAEVPSDLLALIESGSTSDIVSYLQGRQSSLNLVTISEIRRIWSQAKTKRAWVSKLHKSITTAFALNNSMLLHEAIEVAKAADYVDDHVVGAIEILKIMRQQEEERKEDTARAAPSGETTPLKLEASKQEEEASPTIQQPPPAPEPTIKPLSMSWDSSPAGGAGATLTALHRALAALLRLNTNTAGVSDPTKIRVAEETMELRNTVNAWIQVLQHRCKPSGIFRKVDRNIFDVLTFVGGVEKGGSILAPYTNRLCSDFERIKKFNNPNGHSSAYVVMSYILLRHELETILSEYDRVGQKELGDVYYEDSIHRTTACQRDLRQLVEMTSQIEWPFAIQERSAVVPSLSLQRQAEQVLSAAAVGGGSFAVSPIGGSKSGTAKSLDGTDSEGKSYEQRRKESGLRATTMLRQSIAAFSKYFAEQLKALGTSPTRELIASILDERKNKSIGLIARDQVCVALMAVVASGMKAYHILSKRQLWDVVEGLGERLRESSRGLGGVGIPDAVDMVLSITDSKGRNKTVLNRLSGDQLSEVRVRMFLCHCLNQNLLVAFFESLYGDDSAAHVEFLKKYYTIERCMMLPFQHEMASEVMRVVRQLGQIPFALTVDAEIW